MSVKPFFISLKKEDRHRQRKEDAITLFTRVSRLSAIVFSLFGLIANYLLDLKSLIVLSTLGYALFSGINLLAYQFHRRIHIAIPILLTTSFLVFALLTAGTGGIHSSFILFFLMLILAGFWWSEKGGYLLLTGSLVFAIFLLQYDASLKLYFVETLSQKSENGFRILCYLSFAVLLIGGYGLPLLKSTKYLYKSKEDLENRLNEKEMLLKEVHHRVKNNLQTVSSLLRMQSRSIEDEETLNLIKSSQNRVVAMAMVHEMLYQREDLNRVHYRSYVEELGDYLIKSIKGPESKISLKIDIPQIELGIDTAIPLGLIINEAVTNALKYGFQDRQEGEISIVLEKEDKIEYILRIGDNGIGFPETVTHKSTKSLGLKLIHNLSRQLQGSVIRDLSKEGTNYIIRFREATPSTFHSLA